MDLTTPLPPVATVWSATGTSVHDYPEDFALENGNYQCRCLKCETTFVGHKRRPFCRSCNEAARAAYDALTPEEQEIIQCRNRDLLATILPHHEKT